MMDKKLESFNDKLNKVRKNLLPNHPEYIQLGKIPPQSVNIEEAVLGAIMVEKDAINEVIDILSPNVFYKEEHKQIYSSILSLFEKSSPIDILTVTNELRKEGKLEMVGGPFYITDLTNRVGSSANIEYHARILVEKYIARDLIRISGEIQTEAFEETTDVFDLLENAEKEIFKIGQSNEHGDFKDAKKLTSETLKILEERCKSKEAGGVVGIPSGLTALDRITNGFQNPDLIILAGRPGSGKTGLALSIARNACIDHKKSVGIFSLEMSDTQLMERMFAGESEINSYKFRSGDLEDYEWEQLHTKISKIDNSKLFIDDTPGLTAFQFRAKARRLKALHDVDMIILDYIQLMSGGNERKGQNREQEISNISRTLKGVAKELDIPVIALSQLSRDVEKRGGSKRPILSDLRESGSLEQDTDQVMFIYRAEYYGLSEDEDGNSTQGVAEIIVAKNRHGTTETAKVKFIAKYAKFVNEEEYMLVDLDDGIIRPSTRKDHDEPF